jgi:hypothetical protein
MATHGRKRSDESLILALACGTSVEQAAAKASLSVRSVYRRLKEPGFKQRIRAVKAETMERAGSLLTAASLQAVKTLLSLQEGSVSPAIRLAAARAILDLSIRYREMIELQERVAALEAEIANNIQPSSANSAA